MPPFAALAIVSYFLARHAANTFTVSSRDVLTAVYTYPHSKKLTHWLTMLLWAIHLTKVSCVSAVRKRLEAHDCRTIAIHVSCLTLEIAAQRSIANGKRHTSQCETHCVRSLRIKTNSNSCERLMRRDGYEGLTILPRRTTACISSTLLSTTNLVPHW